MKNIKMIALDFDFTLVDHTQNGPYVDPDALRLFIELIKKGVHVGIVTGRSVWAMKDTLENIGISWGKPFPSFYIQRENYIHWNIDGDFIEQEDWNRKINTKTSDFVQELSLHMSRILDVLKERGYKPKNHILFSDFGWEIHYSTLEMAQQAQEIISRETAQVNSREIHRNRMMVNVVPEGSGKGLALKYAGKCKGICPHEILAFGDSSNDLSMLDGRYGFLSGGVDNCEDDVKNEILKNNGIISPYRASKGAADIIESLIIQID